MCMDTHTHKHTDERRAGFASTDRVRRADAAVVSLTRDSRKRCVFCTFGIAKLGC